MIHCQVIISATNRDEANRISDHLTENKLVAGTMITSGPSRYWWQGKIVERESQEFWCGQGCLWVGLVECRNHHRIVLCRDSLLYI